MTTAASYTSLVQELYIAYFGRPADYFGLQNFESALAAANAPTDPAALAAAYSTNSAVKSLIDSFGTSHESAALYGSGSTASFVNAIFENLFDRPAAVAGLNFWVNAIDSGQVSKGDAALAILAGAEPTSNSSQQATADWNLIQAKVTVAGNFTTALGTSSTQIVDYAGADAAQQARLMLAGVTAANATTFDVQTTINNIVAGTTNNTYTLTAGLDTIAGGPGNNTFNAILDNTAGVAAGGQAATLQSFDTITGGNLNNTLNITDFGIGASTAIPAGATITGITTLNINSLEAASLDLSSWAGLTHANILSSAGTDNVTVGDAVALQVVDTAGNVTTSGGATVSLTLDTAHNYTVNGGVATSSVTIKGSAGGSIIDDSTDGNTITSVSVTGSHNNTTINANALTNLTVSGEAFGGVLIHAAAGTRTLDLTMIGDAYTTIIDATATTVDVSATTKASTPIAMTFAAATAISFDDAVDVGFVSGGNLTAANAKSLTISGAGDFNADLGGLNAAAAISAASSSGVITVNLGAGESFTGGTGQDIVSIGAGQTGTVAGGSATNNEIILNDAPGATIADIAAVKNFSIFGVSGSTSGVFDMSKLANNGAGYTSFDVQQSSGDVTFTNAATGSSLSLEGGNSHIVTLQTADGNGATDQVSITLGTTTSGGNTYAQVTPEDSDFVGTATVNLVSNVQSSSSQNTLTSLFDNNLVTLNLSGTGTLEIGTIKTIAGALSISSSVAGTGTYSTILDSVTDNSLATLTIGGSAGIDIASLASTSKAVTIIDNDTAALEITLGDTALTSATFTNNVNSTAATFNLGSISEAGLATLNLNGNVTVTVTGDMVTSGITIAGGTDNAHVTISFAEATASGATDSITLGNGAGDSVTLGTGDAASTQTIVLGNGAGDSIVTTSAGAVNATVGSATTGTDTITANSASSLHATAGNGTNVISDTAAGATIAITAGTGANTITVGANTTGTISLGAHSATTVDAVTIGVSGTSLTAIEKISGLVNANVDTLTFSGDANALTFAQVTAGSVVATGGNTTLLADWVAAADGLGGVVAGAAHNVTWFQFQGNTYLLESVAGQTADAGTMVAGNTLVELVGTGYTFGHATATSTAGGVVHLVG